MSYEYHGTSNPVLQAGQRITNWASGLMQVQQSYVVRSGDVTALDSFKAGNLLDADSPAIDGLFIFPEPSYTDNGNGFARIDISAFGRRKLEPEIRYESQTQTLLYITAPTPVPVDLSCIVATPVLVLVVKTGEPVLITPSTYAGLIDVTRADGSALAPFTLIPSLTLASVQTQSFGHFSEATVRFFNSSTFSQ